MQLRPACLALKSGLVPALAALLMGASTLAFAQKDRVAFGAAPKGDEKRVAARIIMENFPTTCRNLTSAKRNSDGTISAVCSGERFIVTSMFDKASGTARDVAISCTAAKRLLNIDC